MLANTHARALAFDRDGTLYGFEPSPTDASWTIAELETGRVRGEVATLAGGLDGSRDGEGDRARLHAIRAVAALAGDSVRFVEDHGDAWVVRRLERAR